MFRQTTIVVALASLLGLVCLVPAAELPQPHKKTYRHKVYPPKMRPVHRTPVISLPPVTVQPSTSTVRTPDPAAHPAEAVIPAAPQAAIPATATTAEHQPNEATVTVMPPKVVDEAERQLYLTPGGKYTAEDIKANGNLTASQKYAGFKASHDRNPKPGDKICPITDTKANPKCTWIVGGKTYEFCCPPCIDEFVRLAKENPDKIKEPEEYVEK